MGLEKPADKKPQVINKDHMPQKDGQKWTVVDRGSSRVCLRNRMIQLKGQKHRWRKMRSTTNGRREKC